MIFWIWFWAVIAMGADSGYTPRGVGGGGALAGYSISPYSDLRFVGTDMGTLFRSKDKGAHWTPIAHEQVKFSSDLQWASSVGFSSDKKTVFFSEGGKNPKRSRDEGVTWSSVPIPLDEDERILYWAGDPDHAQVIFCATNENLYRTSNLGTRWIRVKEANGHSRGTFFLSKKTNSRVLHAIDQKILISEDGGEHFKTWYQPKGTRIRAFTGGADDSGVTLAWIDTQGKDACSWVERAKDASAEQKKSTIDECGYVWLHRDRDKFSEEAPHFVKSKKEGGRFIRMAQNDSKTIYVTGGDWVRQYGSKIWLSKDAGASWTLIMQVYDWDQHPYQPWPKSKLEYSAVGLDVGWDDNAPSSFEINLRKSSEVGVTGYYFLHVTENFGDLWKAPFTRYADSGEKKKGKRWKSTGLEVTSNLRLKFHPKNPKLGYVSVADIGGLVTEDGGETFRISKVQYNTNYDYAFDPAEENLVYAASGNQHDFPVNINTPLVGEGGIYKSENRGRKWVRLTPASGPFFRQYLSVAYDPRNKIIYGGTQGGGVARSTNGGKQWEWIRSGFPDGEQVIPQLEIDPQDGSVYALLTGDAPSFSNADHTGIYRLNPKASKPKWELLRGDLERPEDVSADVKLWLFPSSFVIDFSDLKRQTLWLTDMENKGAWLASGVWRSTNGGKTWKRMTQFTHPTAITIDPKNPSTVIASGLYDVTGKWGLGGALVTSDGGKSWRKNTKLPLQANLFGVTPDPASPQNGFFLFFGGGILYGPLTHSR